MKFLCVGSAVQDVFLSQSDAFVPVHRGDKWFERLEIGQKFDVNKIDFSTGGGATNSATTFARQGHETVFIGTVGRDPAGEAVVTALDREGINTRHVSYSTKYNTGYSVLLLAPGGERTILTYRGASTHYDKTNFDISHVKNVDWLYATTMSGNFQILRQIFLLARATGARIAYNPGKKELADHGKLMHLLPMVDVLITNREEMAQIVPGKSSIEMIKHAVKLVPIVSITDGAHGAVASDGQQLIVAGLYNHLRRPVDRTGAGDAFGSGLVVKLAEGKALSEAVHFGSANASEVCQAIGSKTNILRRNARVHDMDIRVTRI